MAVRVPNEKRTCERVELMFHACALDDETSRPLGMLSDISMRGLRLTGDRAIPAGEVIRVRLMLPVETAGMNEVVVSCQSRWTRRDTVNRCFQSGFQLESLDELQRVLLTRLIEEFGVADFVMN